MDAAGELVVEVFPVEPFRWIAVIESFSTETTTAAAIDDDVRLSIRSVLRIDEPRFRLVDDLGDPWDVTRAPEQMRRLGVEFSERSWRPDRDPWWRRIRRRSPRLPDCPACGHDWREHEPTQGECGECVYEITHDEPGRPTHPCALMPPVHVRLAARRRPGTR